MNKLKYLILPILLIILLIPIELGAIGDIPYLLKGNFSSLSFFLPIYAGLLSIPGYYYVVVHDAKKKTVKSATRWWIRISFILAMFSCIDGSIEGRLLFPLIVPLALPILFICIWLLCRFEQNK